MGWSGNEIGGTATTQVIARYQLRLAAQKSVEPHPAGKEQWLRTAAFADPAGNAWEIAQLID